MDQQSSTFPLLVIGSIVQWVWNAIISIVLYRMNKTDRDLESLKAQLRLSAEREIERRFEAINRDIAQQLTPVTRLVDEIRKRLDDGDREFRELAQGDHHNELKLVTIMGELKQWVMERSATKDEIRALSADMQNLRNAVAVHLAKRIEQTAEKIDGLAESQMRSRA